MDNTEQLAARYQFLEWAAIINPAILDSLRTEVAGCLQESPGDAEAVASMCERFRLQKDISLHECVLAKAQEYADRDERMAFIHSHRSRVQHEIAKRRHVLSLTTIKLDPSGRLAAWQQRFGLSEEWIAVCAIETIARSSGDCKRWSFERGMHSFRVARIKQKLRCLENAAPEDFPNSWDGLSHSQLMDQIDEISGDLVNLRFDCHPPKNIDFQLGYVALAMFQTMRMSPGDMQDCLKSRGLGDYEEPAIGQAYRRAASKLPLKLRKPKRGPRKT